MIPPSKEQHLIMRIQSLEAQVRRELENRNVLLEQITRLRGTVTRYMELTAGVVREQGGEVIIDLETIKSIGTATRIETEPVEVGRLKIRVFEPPPAEHATNGVQAPAPPMAEG